DAFVALPGGWGTLDELAEILTWKQLGLISKPVGLLNINSYFSSLADQMHKMVEDGFLEKEHLDSFIIEKIPQKLLVNLGIPSV
ncbi:MAG: LOG family protein, partial [Cyclobacteriaceae bacterium]|nr:LOG family protein [Cyclobacteriaceae bacterium]